MRLGCFLVRTTNLRLDGRNLKLVDISHQLVVSSNRNINAFTADLCAVFCETKGKSGHRSCAFQNQLGCIQLLVKRSHSCDLGLLDYTLRWKWYVTLHIFYKNMAQSVNYFYGKGTRPYYNNLALSLDCNKH